jgi:CheY-like chemotaxis protein
MGANVHTVWGMPRRPGDGRRPGISPPGSEPQRDRLELPRHLPASADGPRANDPVDRHEIELLKGQFLASLNHEIRTPLSGLLGMTSLLAETDLDGDQQEYLNAIRECADQLLHTLNAVLDYSSISAGQLKIEESEFHLHQVIEGLAAESLAKAEAKGLRFLFRIAEGLPETAIGDARHVRQAVWHLLRNAEKFTAEGEIELSVAFEPTPANRILLVVAVRDTGIGIEESKLDMLFESFRQIEGGLARPHSGLGLGLALVDRLIRLLKGSVEVESEAGSGSTFTLRIPLRLPSPSSGLARRTTTGGRRILVVDDNRIAQEVVGHILSRAGFDLEFASSGEDGLSMASQSQFDLVLMDLQMPGMDGITAARQFRLLRGYAQVPIIAVTANYSDEHRALCNQAGMQEFLCKPFQKAELIATVQNFLA